MHRIPVLLLVVVLLGCSTRRSGEEGPPLQRTPHAPGTVTAWQQQKFSMFIHFGLYSLPAGIWNNQHIEGYSEQIRAHGKIPREDYHALASKFNPVQWHADSVVALAKRAGMKSIVITAKHHDGFAMYHTQYSGFNVVDATPYKRDIIHELAAACHEHDMKFGVYFSLIDWDFPQALPMSNHNSDSIPPEHHQLNLHQVEELMSNYGSISEIWFDMGKPTERQSLELANLVRRLQPDCLISGRLWNDAGDFAVMGDNATPDFRMGTSWQTPASMFDETWGYRSWQVRENPAEKVREKITSLVKVVSNGGNYLLNIGPMGDGGIVPYEQTVLTGIGKWLQHNGDAIYGTEPSQLPAQSWGVITARPGKLFLIVLHPPANGQLYVKGLRTAGRASWLGASAVLSTTVAGDSCFVDLSGVKLTGEIPVVTLEYTDALDYVPAKVVLAPHVMDTANAVAYHSFSGPDYYTTRPTVIRRAWFLRNVTGNHHLSVTSAASDAGKTVVVSVDDESVELTLSGQAQTLERSFSFRPGIIHTIAVRLADQSNPHRDMGLEALVIRIEP